MTRAQKPSPVELSLLLPLLCRLNGLNPRPVLPLLLLRGVLLPGLKRPRSPAAAGAYSLPGAVRESATAVGFSRGAQTTAAWGPAA